MIEQAVVKLRKINCTMPIKSTAKNYAEGEQKLLHVPLRKTVALSASKVRCPFAPVLRRSRVTQP
jgi:hypothetical protein